MDEYDQLVARAVLTRAAELRHEDDLKRARGIYTRWALLTADDVEG